ncbi:unnamed protein product [Pipistrellus nathusii]|uniref:Secreted protein n=1 Tax=Pipistrellus nathusii TaxID=59473 RepID=A0ABP0A813_PIPNA
MNPTVGIHTRFFLPLLPDLWVVLLLSFKYEQGPSHVLLSFQHTQGRGRLSPASTTWSQENCSRLTSRMGYDSGRQTAACEPHVALRPLECGSSTKYHVRARTCSANETSRPMQRSLFSALKRNLNRWTVDIWLC